jgi:hypothetical protein
MLVLWSQRVRPESNKPGSASKELSGDYSRDGIWFRTSEVNRRTGKLGPRQKRRRLLCTSFENILFG